MSKILPSKIDISGIEKEAERDVLQACSDQLPDEWIAIYSLWIRDPFQPKTKSEVDILLITKKAVICLEVKGGTVARRPDGIWEFYTRRGKLVREKTEGPFEQASKAHYDVKKHLEKNNKKSLSQLSWWYGVVTPHCTMNIPADEIGIAPEEYCDEVMFLEGFPEFLRSLESYAVSKNRRDDGRGIPEHERQFLVDALRPSIRPVDGLGIHIKRLERRFTELTAFQKQIPDAAKTNSSICLEGGAGTGKTVVAFQIACDEARDGRRVLFCCFNRHLSDYLSDLAKGDAGLDTLLVANFHQLLANICRSAGLSDLVPEDWDELNEIAMSLVEKAVEGIEEFSQFDYVVIDEGQDLMRRNFLDVLDLLLVHGLDQGKWLLCLDPEQAIFTDQYDPETETWLLAKAQARLTLNHNVRNTIQIAEYCYGLSAIETRPQASAKGGNPDILYFGDGNELERQLKRTLNRELQDLVESKGSASSLMVLAARKEPYFGMLEKFCNSGLIRTGQQYDPFNGDPNKFSWSTVQAFKGLEADLVILLGVSDLTSLRDRRLLYVGASRARARLIIFFPDSEEDNVASRLEPIFRALQKN